jgi:hypothetical protein
MTPEEWQNYCHQLARRRHGDHNYQPVPDHDRGDLGIESFALDGTGCVYQFYSPEATDTAGRLKAQTRKLNTDLAKLQKYDRRLLDLVGAKIKRWILVVPEYDSKLIVEHATSKGAELVVLGLHCLDNADFRVLVQDESAFTAEREALLRAGVLTAPVEVPAPGATCTVQWAIDNAEEVETLDGKLARLAARHSQAPDQRLRRQFLDYHLFGQNYAEQLASRYPELYERFMREKSKEEADLPLRSLTTPHSPREHVSRVREQYEQRLSENVPGLDKSDVRWLSWAGIAEWMLRCSLDFDEGAS